MARLKVVRSLVIAAMFVLTVAAVNAQGMRSTRASSAWGVEVLPPAPTDPILPPTLQDRGIIWGD